MPAPSWDVLIVGGGPAGLNAALILARCRHRVLLVDDGQPRNRLARELHGLLSRDGVAPHELRRLGRADLARYDVELREATVVAARKSGTSGFEIELEGGDRCRGRILLLASGVRDSLPPIDGLEPLYGISVHHCPYCDGWEQRDRRLAAYGRGRGGVALALKLTGWSADVALLTDGPCRYDTTTRERLDRNGVALVEARVVAAEGHEGHLQRIRFDGREPLERDALFFLPHSHQACELAERLGCTFTRKGSVRTNRLEGTNVPGLYVAGDASWDVQLAVIAAAEGAKAAVAIHETLAKSRLR